MTAESKHRTAHMTTALSRQRHLPPPPPAFFLLNPHPPPHGPDCECDLSRPPPLPRCLSVLLCPALPCPHTALPHTALACPALPSSAPTLVLTNFGQLYSLDSHCCHGVLLGGRLALPTCEDVSKVGEVVCAAVGAGSLEDCVVPQHQVGDGGGQQVQRRQHHRPQGNDASGRGQLNQTGHLKTWREGVGVSAQEREAAERVEGGGWRRHHCATVIRESHLSH